MKVCCKYALDKKLVYGISDRFKRTISAKDDLIKNIEILLTLKQPYMKYRKINVCQNGRATFRSNILSKIIQVLDNFYIK